jgi:hypothetical protein
MQLPLMQTFPQVPQLSGSLVRSTQRPLQGVSEASIQLQAPFPLGPVDEHFWSEPQATPQPPQLEPSACSLTQAIPPSLIGQSLSDGEGQMRPPVLVEVPLVPVVPPPLVAPPPLEPAVPAELAMPLEPPLPPVVPTEVRDAPLALPRVVPVLPLELPVLGAATLVPVPLPLVRSTDRQPAKTASKVAQQERK